jgi:hypothetical protein
MEGAMRRVALGVLMIACVSVAGVGAGAGEVGSPRADLPLPFGIGINYYRQCQGYDLTSLRVNVLPGDLSALEGIAIDNRVSEMNAKLDYWVLPFVNVFGIVGVVDGKTDVDTDLIPGLTVDYEGGIYGGGITLAGGWDRYFVTLTAALTETELDTSRSSVNAWVVSPKAGMTGNWGAAWIGGMYQQTDERHEGSLTLPIYGTVDYEVEFEQKEAWNASLGYTTVIGDLCQVDLEAGFGDRTHASVSATYRF